MRAAWHGALAACAALVLTGADPRACDDQGNTAESLASHAGVRLLLKMSRAVCWSWRKRRGGPGPKGLLSPSASTVHWMESDEEEGRDDPFAGLAMGLYQAAGPRGHSHRGVLV
jgi:hypothetical protein